LDRSSSLFDPGTFMKNYLVYAEKKTPEVILITNGELLITGCSLPENAVQFYAPVFEWLQEYKKLKPEKVNLTLDLEYMNSASVKLILDILKVLKEMIHVKKNFRVIWKYDKDDLDMLDQGKILEKNLKHKFEFVEKPLG
jgi:hypothetical protein